MANNKRTSAAIDGLLNLIVSGSALISFLAVPNSATTLNKPLKLYFKKMDKRARERELRRLTNYMKKQGLVKGSYDHGLDITPAGRKRALKSDFHNLSIPIPKKWDNRWRLVMFDIPESHKKARDYLTHKLKLMGFKQLQQSVWIYPFACRREIETVCLTFDVASYVTYIETEWIDHQDKLTSKFSDILNGKNLRGR